MSHSDHSDTHRHGDGAFDGGGAGDRPQVLGDAVLGRLEAQLVPLLGTPAAGESPASDAFRAELRAQFVSGAIDADIDEREVLGAALDDSLRAWRPARPGDSARRAAELALFGGGQAAPQADVAAPSERRAPRRRPGAGSAPRRRGAGVPRHSIPAPARATRRRLVLVGTAGLLAVAAALFLVVRSGRSDGVGGEGHRTAPVVADSAPAWTIEFVVPAAGGDPDLAQFMIDGAPAADLAALAAALASAGRVETLDATVRLRRGDRFVIELGPSTSVAMPSEGPDGTTYVVDAGAVRVATGPGFDGGELFVVTPHVRTSVRGTIFGVDIGSDYTCVCCLEGEVLAEPIGAGGRACTVGPVQTRVVAVSDLPSGTTLVHPLVEAHAGPLRALTDYWS